MGAKVSMTMGPRVYMTEKRVPMLSREDKEAALVVIYEYLNAIRDTMPNTRVIDNVIEWTDALIDSYIG